MKSVQEDGEIVSKRQTQKAEVRKMTNTFPAHAYMKAVDHAYLNHAMTEFRTRGT